MSLDVGLRPDAYEVLFVHPTAPAELLATMYWALAGDLQRRRAAGEPVDDELHHLTRSYECVAESERRAGYNASFALLTQPLTVRPLSPSRRSVLRRLLRRPTHGSIDLYEVMGVAPNVPPELLSHANRIMRDQYLRLCDGKRRTQLLEALERSYETLRSPEARGRYDARAPKPQNGIRPDSSAAADDAPLKQTSTAASAAKTRKRSIDSAAVTKAKATPVIPPASPANEIKASPPRERLRAKALRQLSRAARLALSMVAAGLRLAYRAMRRGGREARSAWQKWRSRPVTRPAASRAPSAVVTHAPGDRAKRAPSDVEDKFLGRVATSVKESESHLHGADPGQGPGKSP